MARRENHTENEPILHLSDETPEEEKLSAGCRKTMVSGKSVDRNEGPNMPPRPQSITAGMPTFREENSTLEPAARTLKAEDLTQGARGKVLKQDEFYTPFLGPATKLKRTALKHARKYEA